MERLKQIILSRYPNIKISVFNEVATHCKSFKQQIQLIEQLCKHENRIVIIERNSNIRFNKLANELIGELSSTGLNSYRFILLREKAKAISMNCLDELQYIVKHILCPITQECGVCYNRIADGDDVIVCYHCKSLLCICCSQHLYNTTAYWCPYCCNHLIYPEICKPSQYNAELDDCMRLIMEPIAPNGILPPMTYVASLHTDTIDKLCKLGASRNNNFSEYFVKRRAVDIKMREVPIL